MEALLETKIFKVSVERLLLNGGQTLYMVGIALLIGTVIGTLLALVLVLCRKGGLVENKVLHSIVSLYINVVFQRVLSERGVCVSVKSACSAEGTPSKAVFAVSGDRKNALSSWRVSLSHLTTREELDEFLQVFDQCYKELGP